MPVILIGTECLFETKLVAIYRRHMKELLSYLRLISKAHIKEALTIAEAKILAEWVSSPEQKQNPPIRLAKLIRLILKIIAGLLKKFFSYTYRDLRKTFRSIIRFLFKNLDDCSGENNALKNLTHQPLLIPNYYFHDEQRDYHITK